MQSLRWILLERFDRLKHHDRSDRCGRRVLKALQPYVLRNRPLVPTKSGVWAGTNRA